MTGPERAEFEAALALLARGLTGAIDVAGLEHLPRPSFPAPAAKATPETQPTTTAQPTATAQATTTTSPATTTTASPAKTTLPVEIATPIAAVAADGASDVVGSALRATLHGLVADARPAAVRLKVLNDDVIGACTRCKLSRGRNNLVFGVGNPKARLVFVGEGPGEAEDREGVPFVGAAGQLLTKMIGAMGFARDDVYIANVVKCRPPNNRDPEADEVDACEGFLKCQLGIVQPDVIVGLGRVACQTLLRTQTPISKLRGTWQKYDGVDFMPTFHPSYLLREDRDPEQKRKRESWSDLKLVMEKLKQR